MTIKEDIDFFSKYQKGHLKQRSIHSYKYIMNKFESTYGNHQFESIGSDDVLQFLEDLTGNSAKATRKLRYAQLKTFFNFIIGNFDLNVKNPCSSSQLSKTFSTVPQRARKVLEKEVVDEMIYNTRNLRDRLMLELQARCGLSEWGRIFTGC